MLNPQSTYPLREGHIYTLWNLSQMEILVTLISFLWHWSCTIFAKQSNFCSKTCIAHQNILNLTKVTLVGLPILHVWSSMYGIKNGCAMSSWLNSVSHTKSMYNVERTEARNVEKKWSESTTNGKWSRDQSCWDRTDVLVHWLSFGLVVIIYVAGRGEP